jgi:acyl carrier protein
MKVANLGRAVAAVGGAVYAAGVAVAAGGVSVGAAAVAVGVAALELAGRSHPDIWSNPWTVGGVVIGGIGLLIVVAVVVIGLVRVAAGLFQREAAARPDDRRPEPSSTRQVGTTETKQGDPKVLGVRTSKEILAGLAEIISEIANVPADRVRPEKNFVVDFDIDSLSMVEIAVAAQDKFGIEIPDRQLKELKTVQDVVNFVNNNS